MLLGALGGGLEVRRDDCSFVLYEALLFSYELHEEGCLLDGEMIESSLEMIIVPFYALWSTPVLVVLKNRKKFNFLKSRLKSRLNKQ